MNGHTVGGGRQEGGKRWDMQDGEGEGRTVKNNFCLKIA